MQINVSLKSLRRAHNVYNQRVGLSAFLYGGIDVLSCVGEMVKNITPLKYLWDTV